MSAVVWTGLAFLCGSIPFAVIIGRLTAHADIREYGDHNPGATNVLRVAGWRWFAATLLLDFFKAAVPVSLAWFMFGLRRWLIVPVAIAPLVGHAYSPWLRFRGGKALASTFGVWAGLTLGVGPTVLGLLMPLLFGVLTASGWAVVTALLVFGGFVVPYYGRGHPELAVIWLANVVLVAWRYRADLRQPLDLRPWLLRLVRRAP